MMRSGSRRKPEGLRYAWLLLATLSVLLSIGTTARAASPAFLGPKQVDPNGSALNAVSCSSPSFCVTGGQELVVQDHGVQSDLSSDLSSDIDEIASISCAPGTRFCMLADDSGGVTPYVNGVVGQREQIAPNSVADPNGFDSVSCPVDGFCMAIDQEGNTFAFKGGTWGSAVPIGSLSTTLSDLQVSCVSASFCVAALPASGSNEDYYLYKGSGWNPGSVMDSDGAAISGLSCTSTTFCVATDTRDFGLNFNGTHWTSTSARLVAGTASDDQFYVSCAGTFCLATSFQTGDTLTTTNGTTWTAGASLQDPDTGNGAGGPTSCASATMCVTVDQGGVGNTYALPDTLATQPSLAGPTTVGGTLTLTPGSVSNPDASVVDNFQRCLDGCTQLTPAPSSYTTTAADVGATFQDSETAGVGLDTKGPFATGSIGPITNPSTGTGTGGSPSGGGGSPSGGGGSPSGGGGSPSGGGGSPSGGGGSPSGGGGTSTSHPEDATLGAIRVSGSGAQVSVSCPSGSSSSCSVKVTLVVTETLSGNKVIAVSAKKHKTTKRKVTLGSVSATVSPGGSKQVTITLNRAGEKLLAARHTLKADLAVAENGTSLGSKQVRFAAPKKKKKK
jgi:hypothetical protein